MANDGPRMKRIRPAPMGRAYRYQRRLSHIVISVAERDGGSRSSLVTTVGEDETGAQGEEGGGEEGSGKEGSREEDGSKEISSQEEGCEVGFKGARKV